MSQSVIVYSQNDIKKFIKKEIDSRFYFYDKMLNTLHSKVADLDRIIRGLMTNDRRRNKRRTNRKS